MLIADISPALERLSQVAASRLEGEADELESLLALRPAVCAERASALAQAAQEDGDLPTEMKARYFLGAALSMRGELVEAESQVRRAFALSSACRDDSWRARTLMGLGVLYKDRCEFDRALEWLGQSLDLSRAIDDKRSVAICLCNTASVLRSLGMLEDAISLLERARSIHVEQGNTSRAARLLWVMADCHVDRAEQARRAGEAVVERAEAVKAQEMMQRALRDDRSAVYPAIELAGLLALCNANLMLGDLAAARQAMESVDAMLASTRMPATYVARDVMMAKLERAQGNLSSALTLLKDALTRCEPCPYDSSTVLEQLALTRQAMGDATGAARDMREVERRRRSVYDESAMSRAKLLMRHLGPECER
jgi:tetratricopeptide (TPR) repeat protein